MQTKPLSAHVPTDEEIRVLDEQLTFRLYAQRDRLREINAELLDALERFTSVWDSGRKFANMDVDEIESMRKQARAAIQKAKGE